MNLDDIENKFPYLGISTFYSYSYSKNLIGADIAMVGVPFDHGTTNRPGTRFGPRAIRSASQNYGIYINPSIKIGTIQKLPLKSQTQSLMRDGKLFLKHQIEG